MKTPAKLGGFALVLGMTFAAAYGAGALAGPVAGRAETASEAMDASHSMAADSDADEQAAGPAGLAVAADGYTLRAASAAPGEFAFQIFDTGQRPVTAFQTSHTKQLHLIVVRRDLTGFQHLHPQMDPDGTWRIPMTLPSAGDWRAFADFLPAGRDRQVVLGLDVPIRGDYQPRALPPASTATTVDGYTVNVDGTLAAGRTSRLMLSVSKDGRPVTDLQPYLGAYGHLVALRAGDLGYLHVHPQESAAAGPAVTFDVEVPTAGAYRLFLDFQHGGVVRTAQFTAPAA